MFRPLKANEVDVFPKMVKEKGCLILLYKDARCDMNILDETVGALGWKREHLRENANCVVSLWDKDNKHWVSKEDTGTESNQDKTKGLASDSFKRACFNWGIGRELYTGPFIWITLNANETYCTNPKETDSRKKKYSIDIKVKFHVTHLVVVNKIITELKICDQTNKERFSFKTGNVVKATKKQLDELYLTAESKGYSGTSVEKTSNAHYHAMPNELTIDVFNKLLEGFKKAEPKEVK